MDFSRLDKSDLKNIDTIFHEAAYAGVRYSVEKPLLYDKTNVHSTVKLLDLAVDSGIDKFIYASSSSVYGDVKEYPTPEGIPLSPKSPYGVSKLAAEKYCDAFYECYGLPTISLRYFTVFGPWGRPDILVLKAIKSCFNERKLLLSLKTRKEK